MASAKQAASLLAASPGVFEKHGVIVKVLSTFSLKNG